jgi:hypothetical protein
MQRSKSLALSFLLGALLVGGALGFTADRVLGRDAYCRQRGDRGAMRKRLADDLALTSSQRLAVDSILDRRHHEMTAIMAPLRPRLDSARDRARSDIRKLLDAGQRERFQKLLDAPREQERR